MPLCILCRDFTLGCSELLLGGGLPRYLVNRMIYNECISSTKHPTDDFLFLIFLCRFELLKLKDIFNPSNAKDFFRPNHKDAKIFENHLNFVMLVFIG